MERRLFAAFLLIVIVSINSVLANSYEISQESVLNQDSALVSGTECSELLFKMLILSDSQFQQIEF